MKLGMSGQNLSEERLRYIKQLGSDGIFLDAGVLPGYKERGYATVDELARSQADGRGLRAGNPESPHRKPRTPHPSSRDRPDRDQAIDRICATVRAAGEVGIPTVFYNLTFGAAWAPPGATTPACPAPAPVTWTTAPARPLPPPRRAGWARCS